MRKGFLCLAMFVVCPVFFEGVLCAQDSSGKLNMLEIVVSNLVARVEALEKRISVLEKGAPGGAVKAPKKEPSGKESSGKDSSRSALSNGFENIGGGFFIRNVRFNPFGPNVLFTGEIANRSEKNYRFAKFTLELYDDNDLPIKKEEFSIPDIPKDTVKSFEVMLAGVDSNLVNRYVVKVSE